MSKFDRLLIAIYNQFRLYKQRAKCTQLKVSIMTNNVNFNTEYMGAKQLVNVGRLLVKVEQLEWDLDDLYIGYNNVFGNTYIYSENEQYSVFISDYDSTVKALYTCFVDGEEVERNCSNNGTMMEKWAKKQYQLSCKKESSK